MRRVIAFSVLLTASAVSAAQPSWKKVWRPVGLAGGGAMFSAAGSPHDPRLMMISCDMSGAYLSHDGGRTWTMIHHRELRGCVYCAPLFHPLKPRVIYSPSGWRGRLKVTKDGGLSWRPFAEGAPFRGRVGGLFLSRRGEFFVSTDSGLWLGDETGRKWRKSQGVSGHFLNMLSDARDPRRFYIGTESGVFRSDDGGKTFSRISGDLPGDKLTAFAGGSSAKETILYAACPSSVRNGKLAGGLYRSRDGGRTWRRIMNPDINLQTRRSSRWANGDIPRYLFLCTTSRDPSRVYVYCTGTSYFPPNHSTVYRSDDAGRRWRAVFFSDPRFKDLYNVEDDRITLSIGQRYQDIPFSFAVNPAHPDTLIMTTSMEIFFSHDGGRSWKVSQLGPPRKFGKLYAWPCNGLVVTTTWQYAFDPFDPKRHYICYTDVGFARSLDAGRTWIWEGHRLPWHNTTYQIAFDPEVPGKMWGAFSNTHDIPNGNIIYGRHRVRMQGGVAVSTDHGHTWKKLNLPEAPCVSVILDPRSPPSARTLYAALFEKGVFRSTDGGRTWVKRSRGLGSTRNMRSCRLFLHRDGTLFNLITAKRLPDGTYESEGVGLYRSRDRGESWEKINRSLPLRWVKDFAVDPEDSNTVLLGAANLRGFPQAGLYRTTDGGKSWKRIAAKGPEHFGAAFHPKHRGWIYMTLTEGAREAGLYLSRDDGATWESFTELPFSNIQRVHFDPHRKNRIYVTTFGGSVFEGPDEPGGKR